MGRLRRNLELTILPGGRGIGLPRSAKVPAADLQRTGGASGLALEQAFDALRRIGGQTLVLEQLEGMRGAQAQPITLQQCALAHLVDEPAPEEGAAARGAGVIADRCGFLCNDDPENRGCC